MSYMHAHTTHLSISHHILSLFLFLFFFFNLFAINLWLYLLYISLLYHYPIYIWWDILLKVKIICLNFISLSFLFGYLNVKERTCYGEITWSLLQKFLSCNLLGFHDNNSNYYCKKFDIMIKYIDIRKKKCFIWICLNLKVRMLVNNLRWLDWEGKEDYIYYFGILNRFGRLGERARLFFIF